MALLHQQPFSPYWRRDGTRRAVALPVYKKWEQVPDTLATRTQLRRERLMVPDGTEPAAMIARYGRIHPLYLRADAGPRPAPRHPRRDYPAIFSERYGDTRAAYRDACEALFSLNRFAKHERCAERQRLTIYDLKNRLLAKLWLEGFCIQAYVARSPTHVVGICYACDGSGEDDDMGEECWRCSGSGTYTAGGRAYWALRFVVDEQPYAWHQPFYLARWATAVGEPPAVAHDVVAVEKPVTLAQRRFAEAKALLRWVCGDEDVEDKALALALDRSGRTPDPALDDIPF